MSGSEDYDQVANFLEDLEDPSLSTLTGVFNRPADLQATLNAADETLIPSVTWSFPLNMSLLSPEDRVKNRESAEGGAK